MQPKIYRDPSQNPNYQFSRYDEILKKMAEQSKPKQTAPAKQRGRGGTATSLISEGAGILGGALGTLLLPGVGTAIGAGLGAGLGRIGENKIRDNRIGLGDAAKEGALSAALSFIPGGKSVKGAGSVADDAVRTGGKLSKLGNAMRANPRGIVAGIEQGGKAPLSTAAADAQNAAIDKIAKGTKGLTKSGQFTQIEKRIKDLTSQYTKSKEAKLPFGEENALNLLNRIEANITSNPNLRGTLTGQSKAVLDNIYTDVAKLSKMSNADLIEYSSKINKNAASIAKKGNVGSKTVQIWEEARNATKSFIDEELLARSSTNKELSTLIGARGNLSKAITADKSAGMTQGITPGRLFSNVAGGGLEVGGRAAQAVGRLTNTTAVRQGVRQLGGRSLLGGALGGPQEPGLTDPNAMQAGEDNQLQLTGVPTDMVGGYQAMQQPQEQTYTLQDALMDSRRDPKNATQYLAYAKAFEAQAKTAKPAVKAQDAQAAGSQALAIVDQLEQAYKQAGGAQGRIAGTANTLLGKAGGNDAVNVYNENKMAFLSNVARSLGEKGVLTDADIERVSKAFPSPSANPAEAAAKWSMIKTIISGGVQRAQSAYGANNYQLADILSQGQ